MTSNSDLAQKTKAWLARLEASNVNWDGTPMTAGEYRFVTDAEWEKLNKENNK